jgi:hypothetical protein
VIPLIYRAVVIHYFSTNTGPESNPAGAGLPGNGVMHMMWGNNNPDYLSMVLMTAWPVWLSEKNQYKKLPVNAEIIHINTKP